jgi:hypothetical protein
VDAKNGESRSELAEAFSSGLTIRCFQLSVMKAYCSGASRVMVTSTSQLPLTPGVTGKPDTEDSFQPA